MPLGRDSFRRNRVAPIGKSYHRPLCASSEARAVFQIMTFLVQRQLGATSLPSSGIPVDRHLPGLNNQLDASQEEGAQGQENDSHRK